MCVGISRDRFDPADAVRMAALLREAGDELAPAMLAQRVRFEPAGVTFEPIHNHEVDWHLGRRRAARVRPRQACRARGALIGGVGDPVAALGMRAVLGAAQVLPGPFLERSSFPHDGSHRSPV